MKLLVSLALVIVLTPALALAALNAGVVDGVWFSNPNPEEGEEVRIFTAVQNSSTETIQGTVAFLVNDDIVGTTAFSVASNDIIPVSVAYIFSGGDHDVSAYITSVEEDNVAYTIVPDASVSVARRTVLEEEKSSNIESATSTLNAVTETVSETGKDVVSRVDPIAESAAQRVEEFRNSLLTETSTSTPATEVTPTETQDVDTNIEENSPATQIFFNDSKAIVASDNISIWKKMVGISLSVLALLLRFWFVFVILTVGLLFWIFIRGRRIR